MVWGWRCAVVCGGCNIVYSGVLCELACLWDLCGQGL